MEEAAAARAPQALEPGSELDLCFICDCTGSMSSYIKAAQANITNIVEKISRQDEVGVRFGLISYRDHPPQDRSYVTKSFPFTDDKSEMKAYVDTMSAKGGGDGPEAVTAGLYEALHLPWRPNATKVCVLIADAPPHGLEPRGDGFPNGDPDGHDPLEIAREMVIQGITVYTVGCEPALGAYVFARDFLCTLAEITSGQAVALSSASLLADVIIYGSGEELNLAKLQGQVEQEILKVQEEVRATGADIEAPEAVRRACANLHAVGMKSVQAETDGRMRNATKGRWGGVAAAERKTLAQVKEDLASVCAKEETESLARRSGSLESCSEKGCSYAGVADGSARVWHPAKGRPSMLGTVMSWLPSFSTSRDDEEERTPCHAAAKGSRAEPRVAASAYATKTDLISEEQVARIMQRANYQDRLL